MVPLCRSEPPVVAWRWDGDTLGRRRGAEVVGIDASNANVNANANASAHAHARGKAANPKLSLTNPDDTDTIADEAVYAALVDLLRRSRPAQSSLRFLPLERRGGGAGAGGAGTGGSDPSTSTRTDAAEASIIRGDGSSAGGADRHERQHAHAHTRDGDSDSAGLGRIGTVPRPAAVEMGEVERGMLLAVFERAWLGLH